MRKRKKLSEKQKQELVDALKILYPTPLCEKTIDRLDPKYIAATEFIDNNYAKLDNSLRAFFPEFVFLMDGDIEFVCSEIFDLDIYCKKGKNQKVISFSADGRLESVKSLEDFQEFVKNKTKL